MGVLGVGDVGALKGAVLRFERGAVSEIGRAQTASGLFWSNACGRIIGQMASTWRQLRFWQWPAVS
jgi:hypothetical protein